MRLSMNSDNQDIVRVNNETAGKDRGNRRHTAAD